MTSFIGDNDEMLIRYPSDEEAEALIRGEEPQDSGLVEAASLVSSLRSLGDQKISDHVAAEHLAMIVPEVDVSSTVDVGSNRSVSAPRGRRRVVLSSLLSSLLAKVLVVSVAVAAVAAGVSGTADNAVPGERLYGLDRALEQVGIGDGGAAERADEARSLVETDLPEAVETAGEAALAHGDAEAAVALADAAEIIRSIEDGQSGMIRELVASLLDLLSAQIAGDGLVGPDLADLARNISESVVLPDQAVEGQTPPADTPPADVPPADVPPEAETAATVPDVTPPVSPPVATP